jgi:hypothetical protein
MHVIPGKTLGLVDIAQVSAARRAFDGARRIVPAGKALFSQTLVGVAAIGKLSRHLAQQIKKMAPICAIY